MKFVGSIICFLVVAVVGANAEALRGNDDAAHVSRRSLQQQQHVDGIDDFVSLSCNSNIERATCVNWSSALGSIDVYNDRVTVPCGQCITMDRQGKIQFNGGLDVIGKLVIPDKSAIELVSTMITVQGQLEMTSTKPVDAQNSIKFTMIGNSDMSFEPVGENANNCRGAATCAIGKKSIVVAGGQVDSECSKVVACMSVQARETVTLTKLFVSNYHNFHSQWIALQHSNVGAFARCFRRNLSRTHSNNY